MIEFICFTFPSFRQLSEEAVQQIETFGLPIDAHFVLVIVFLFN